VVALFILPFLGTLTACGGGSSSTTATDPGTSASAPASESSSAGGTTCQFTSDGRQPAKKVTPPPATPTVSGRVPATIKTSVGTFQATLDAKQAPCTVESFVSLAKQGWFDNTPCHRLTLPSTGIQVLQCGDPTGTGTGGPGYSFPDELSGNETYPTGTLAMANAGPNTNGSQFFVVYGDTPLPPNYTVFGKVSPQSVKLIDKVAAKGVDNAFGPGDGHPKEKVTITKVTTG